MNGSHPTATPPLLEWQGVRVLPSSIQTATGARNITNAVLQAVEASR